MTFVVNGADWQFEGMPTGDIENSIDDFLEFIRVSKERGETVKIGDDFQKKIMHGTLSLWEMFAEGADQSLSGELRQEMAAWLVAVEYYLDADEWPDGAEETLIRIGEGEPLENADAAWVHHSVRAGRAAACVTLCEETALETATNSGIANIHFVRGEKGRRVFWRNQVLLEGDSEASLRRLAPHAYPDLHFVDGVLNHMNDLTGGYHGLRERIKSTFAILDDFGSWAFTNPSAALIPSEEDVGAVGEQPRNEIVEIRFRGFGVILAPENPNVRLDRKCREAREIVLEGRTLYCEWHVKLEPHQNRIHIHKPVIESSNKVIVGMIANHLPLP